MYGLTPLMAAHYFSGPVTAAANVVAGVRMPVALTKWLETNAYTCAGCRQTIAKGINYRIIDGSTFHPSCAQRHRVATVRATVSPTVIGKVCGVAVPFGEYCTIFDASRVERFERFEYGAFDASIARGGQHVEVDHGNVPIPGHLELYAGPDLRFRLHVQDSSLGREVLGKAKTGVYRGVLALTLIRNPSDRSARILPLTK